MIKRIIRVIISTYYKFRIILHHRSYCNMTEEYAEAVLNEAYQPSLYKLGNKEDEAYNKCDLSLIIPVYNAEQCIRRCVECLRNQKTKYTYELIFVNDGSTDSSAQILKEYESNNVTLINQKNLGIAGARNTGIRAAQGKYIGFIDNDDTVTNDYVETLLTRAFTMNADIVKCDCVEIEEYSGRELRCYTQKDVSVSGYMGICLLEYHGFIWGGCYSRKFWGNILFPEGYWYEDMITRFLLYRRSTQFEYIGRKMYYKHEHVTNAARTLWDSGNMKSLDQYYLVLECLRINDLYMLPRDETVYRLILSEFSWMLGHRTELLSKNVRRAVFVMACTTLSKYQLDYPVILDDEVLAKYQKSFVTHDFKLWCLLSNYKRFSY